MRTTTSSARLGRNKRHICASRRRVQGFNAAARVCSGDRGGSGAGAAVLMRCFAFDRRSALRFCRGACPRFTPVFFSLSGKKRRLATACVSVPPGRDRHSCVLGTLFGYLLWMVHFGFVRLSVAISTGLAGMRGNGEVIRNAKLGRGIESVRACCSGKAVCTRSGAGTAVLLWCFAFGSRLLFVLRQTGRLAISCVSVPPGRDRLRAFSGRSSVICFGWFTSGLCVYLWRSRRG